MDILGLPAELLVHPMQLQLYLEVVHLGRVEHLKEDMKDKIREAQRDNCLEEHHTWLHLVVYLDLVDMPEVKGSILLDLVLVVLVVEPMGLEADKIQVLLMDRLVLLVLVVRLEPSEVDNQDIRRLEVHLADSCHKDLF